ncbi:unnamed protein product [Chilo suppressalis]|uniref:Uncharacterized protein n=1 Tax=Chilo suppressalis TaxID=168631 RepID=A0ABN8AZQ7_CHISP|nr:unnamed protein product [Chilo suppressalis]
MANAVVNMNTFGDVRLVNLIIILLLVTLTPCSARGYGRSHSSHGRYSHSSHGSGGAHSYPASTGYSGTGSGNLHSNHASGTGSGNAYSYPASTGLSGNNYNSHITKQSTTHQQHNNPNHGTKTEVHHHYHQNYHYSPPQQVSYGSVSYPVYHAQPPVYVYQYRDSGSRFDNLLTGLALYNLGRMSANHDHHHHYDADRRYVSAPGEVCKLGIKKKNGDYEETRVDCELMSSFIWESDKQTSLHATPKTLNTVSTSVVNVTQVQTGEAKTNHSVTTITVTNTTVVDALQAKGQSIEVTPEMVCYMIRTSRSSNIMRKEIKCGILQAYAQSSWRHNGCEGISSSVIMILFTLLLRFEVF